MSKVIYSLSMFQSPSTATPWHWGFYRRFLPAVVRAFPHVYPGWELHIQHDASFFRGWYTGALFNLQRRVPWLKLHCMRDHAEALSEGSVEWRLWPIWNTDADYVFARDVDSLPMVKDRLCCEDFMRSGYMLHSQSDFPSHIGEPMMAGMAGFDARQVRARWPSFDLICGAVQLHDHRGEDQHLLRKLFVERAPDKLLAHRFRVGDFKSLEAETRRAVPTDIQPLGTPSVVVERNDSFCEGLGVPFEQDPVIQWYDANVATPDIAAVHAAEQESGQSPIQPGFGPPKKVVALACDQSPFYAFDLPLTARLWQAVAQRHPMLFLVGSAAQWAKDPALLWARSFGADVVFVDPLPRFIALPKDEAFPFWRTSTIAQCVRLFAWQYGTEFGPLADDVSVMTGDADMWPLDPAFFAKGQPGFFNLYYGNAYPPELKRFPICYLEAPVATWREVFGADGSVHDVLRSHPETFGAGDDKSRNDAAWNFDEDFAGRRITAWPGYGTRTCIVERKGGPPVDRVSKGEWKERLDGLVPDGLVDIHLPRRTWQVQDYTWMRACKVLKKYAPETLTWAQAYHDGWLKWYEENWYG